MLILYKGLTLVKIFDKLSSARIHVFILDDLVRLKRRDKLPMFFYGYTKSFSVYDAIA